MYFFHSISFWWISSNVTHWAFNWKNRQRNVVILIILSALSHLCKQDFTFIVLKWSLPRSKRVVTIHLFGMILAASFLQVSVRFNINSQFTVDWKSHTEPLKCKWNWTGCDPVKLSFKASPKKTHCTQLAMLTIPRSFSYSLHLFNMPIPDVPADHSLADHPP